MLIGMLPPVANAKDDAYILYSEDGEHVKKMKREFFTADIEQVGCDYWKEGTGDDRQNTGGKQEPYNADQYNTDGAIPHKNQQYSGDDADINYYIYDAAKASKYCHYGDYWICFKLREGESEVNSNYLVCGARAEIDATYMADPSQTRSHLQDVTRIGGYPVAIMKYPGSPLFSPQQYLTGNTDHFITKNNRTVVTTFGRYYGYGLYGVPQDGTVYSATMNYKDGFLSPSNFVYRSKPPLTYTDTYELKFDDEVKRLANEYYDYQDGDGPIYDSPEPVDKIITWSDLYNRAHNDPNNLQHKFWKLGVGGTVIAAPSQITPSFSHILPIVNRHPYMTGNTHSRIPSLNAPRGILRSIAVVGVESYSGRAIYDGYREDYYDHGKSHPYYLEVLDYYSYVDYYFYYKSLALYPIRNGVSSFNMIGNEPSYYINDMASGFTLNNYFAVSRKGITISIQQHMEDYNPHYGDYVKNGYNLYMTIGHIGHMGKYTIDSRVYNVDDVADLDYSVPSGEGFYHVPRKPQYFPDDSRFYWQKTEYGDNNLELGTVKVDTSLSDPSYYPPDCDYRMAGGRLDAWSFKRLFAAEDDYIFDTNNTLNVVRNVPDPETGAPYDIYSLHTLWKMNIRVNGTTKYTIDTTFNNTRPQIMELKFNPNSTTNYGFGNEIAIDTTNNTETIKGFRVDSNKVRYAGAKTIRENGIVMMDDTGHYQSIRLTNAESGSTYNVQGNTTAKFRPETLYYCTRNVENGQAINDLVNERVSPLYKSYKSVLLSDIAGWSSPYGARNGDLYLVGTMDSDGYFSVVSNAYKSTAPRRYGFITQDLPYSEDGLYYIYLGKYVNSGVASECVFDFAEFNPIYYYKEGGIRVYKYYEPRTVVNGFVYKTNSQASEVDATDSSGHVYLRFDSTQFENQYNRSDGNLTLKIKQSVFDSLPPFDVLALTDDEAMLNIASSNTLTKVCDITGLRFQDNSTYYIDVNIIFRTTDGTPMTDGVFEARLSYWYDPSIDGWIDGTSGEPVGYYKKRKSFIDGESELVIKMKGYINNGMARGGQYPYLLVRHSCSTNIDVGYSITGYFVKK